MIHKQLSPQFLDIIWKVNSDHETKTPDFKLIKSGPLAAVDDLQRFKSESVIGGQLHHPGIVLAFNYCKNQSITVFT